METLFNDDYERQLLEKALENEQILKALGPLNTNWFDDLNEEVVQELFDDSFTDKTNSNSVKDEQIQSHVTKVSTEDVEACSSKNVTQSVEQTSAVDEKPVAAFADVLHLDSCIASEGDMIKVAEEFEQKYNAEFSRTISESTTTAHLHQDKANITTAPTNDMQSSKPLFSHKEIISDRLPTSANKPVQHNCCHEQVSKKRRINVNNSNPAPFKSSGKDNNFQDLSSATGFTTASNKPLRCSSEALIKAKSLLIKNNDESNPTIDGPDNHGLAQCGFKTASNKPMSISKQALVKANIMFAKIDNDSVAGDATSDLEKSNANSRKKLSEGNENYSNNVENTSCETLNVGFKTASNKLMSISNTAWKKGNDFMKSVGDPSDDTNVLPQTNITQSSNTIPSLVSSEIKPNCVTPVHSENHIPCTNGINRRLSFPGISTNSPLLKPPKAKRRNSLYRPPRKRTPLLDVQNSLPLSCNLNSNAQQCVPRTISSDTKLAAKKQLGIRQDQENQIYVSDENLLKAVTLFERV